MQLLYFFESIRNPLCDAFFSFITEFGDETLFMVVGMIFFWCVNKFTGYYLLITGFFGTVINQFLKLIFRIPRPWVKDPNFTVVGNAKDGAGGFSFPSGHTQTSVGLFGGVARANKNKVLKIVSIALCVLVPLSRMYLGVHTPLDVGVSVAIALIMVFAFYPLFKKAEKSPKVMYGIITALGVLVVAFMLYVYLYPFPDSVYLPENVINLQSAVKNAHTLLGCMLGFLVVYFVDTNYVKFEVKAVWWAQILKVIGGLACVLLVKEVLRFPIDFICSGHIIGRTIRYFLMVVVGGVVWPLTFKWFARLGKKNG
ncbi:MAG: phosphatase PAP2 family protein [Clostridia bacterium]|nr:phosphatase PAP2 family protein [Clostridia bacterium]